MRWLKFALLVGCGFGLQLGLPAVHAQDQAADEATPAAIEPADVQQALDNLANGGDLPAETLAALNDTYQKALVAATAAAEARERARQLVAEREQAPARVAELKAELATDPPPLEEPAPGAELATLEQRLAQLTTEQRAANERLAQLEDEQRRRANRRIEIPKEQQATQERLQALRDSALPADESLTAQQRAALTLLRQAQLEQLQAESNALNEELLSYDARTELLTLRRDRAARAAKRLNDQVAAFQRVVERRRANDVAAQVRDAQRRLDALADAPAVVQAFAQTNLALAEERRDLSAKIADLAGNAEEISETLETLDDTRSVIRNQVEYVGLTDEVGQALREQRERLQGLNRLELDLAERERERGQAFLRVNELREDRNDLSDLTPDAVITGLLDAAEARLGDEQRERLTEALRPMVAARQRYLDRLIEEYNDYQADLSDLVAVERRLVETMQAFSDYVDQRVLWIRSAPWPGLQTLRDAGTALVWLAKPEHWRQVGQAFLSHGQRQPLNLVVGLGLLGLIFGLRRQFKQRLRASSDIAARSTCTAFGPTLVATLCTVLLALAWPLLFILVGRVFVRAPGSEVFIRALGEACFAIGGGLFIALLFFQLCRPKGLAEAHFDWPPKSLRKLTRELSWLVPIGLVVGVLHHMLNWTREPDWINSLGRFAFIALQVLIALFVWRLFRAGGAVHDTKVAKPDSWFARTYRVWYLLVLGTPVALGVLSLTGYHYSATQLLSGVRSTLGLMLVITLLNALALRWILVSNRKLKLEQDRQRRIALREQIAKAAQGQEVDTKMPDESPLDLSIVSSQVLRLLKGFTTLALIAGLWSIWADDLPVLRALDNVHLWSVAENGPAAAVPNLTGEAASADGAAEGEAVAAAAIGESQRFVTLANLLIAVIVLVVTVLFSKNLPGLLEIAVLQRLPMQAGERYAISTVTSYFLLIVGFIISFSVIGIGWSQVQWLVAAISVGLGFGLQEIFANFVSGLIILFERPIRIGDIVTVGNIDGKVTRIRMRATTITDWDRRELVVPNREFITSRLVNWTLSDPVTRVIVPVGIAYGSDTRKAEQTLLKIARECPLLMSDPEPRALFLGFGDSSLNFELRAYMPTRDQWQALMHELHTTIDDEFKAAGIEIAFPQRDLHIRSVEKTFRVETLPAAEAKVEERQIR